MRKRIEGRIKSLSITNLIEAEAGGSSFSRVMIEMANASAKGGKTLEGFAKVAGMSGKEFQKSFKKDASGTIISFIEGLGKMSAEGKNTFAVLEGLGLSEIRVRDALLRASGSGDLFRESLELGNKAWKENTALTDEAKQRYETTAAQLAILRNTVVDGAKSLGDALLPAIQKVTKIVKGLAERFNNLSERTKSIIAIGSAIAAIFALVAGPLLLLIGFIPQIIVGFQALSTVFAAVTGPVGLTIAAIVGIIAAMVIAYKKVEWFRNMVNDAWAWIKEASIVAFEAVKNVIIAIIDDIVAFAVPIIEQFKQFWADNGEQILSYVKMYFGLVWEFIKLIIGHIKSVFQIVWPIIAGVVKIAWNNIKFYVKHYIDLVLGIVNTIMALLRGDWEGAWESIKDTAVKIWENIVEYFESVNLKQIGADIISGLLDGMSSMVDNVKKGVKNIGTKIKNGFTDFFGIKSPSRLMMSLAKHIPGGAIKGIESMTSKLQAATNRMADAMLPDTPQVSMAYATPNGVHSTLASAVNGTVDVNTREDKIVDELRSLRQDMTNLSIELDGRTVGQAVEQRQMRGLHRARRL